MGRLRRLGDYLLGDGVLDIEPLGSLAWTPLSVNKVPVGLCKPILTLWANDAETRGFELFLRAILIIFNMLKLQIGLTFIFVRSQ